MYLYCIGLDVPYKLFLLSSTNRALNPLRPPSTTLYLHHLRTTTSCSEMIDDSRKGGKQRQRGIRKSFKWEVNTSSVVVLDCTEMSPSLKLNLTELYRTSATAISLTVGLIHIYWSSNHSRRPMRAVVRQCWKGSLKRWILNFSCQFLYTLYLFDPINFFHHRVVRKCPQRSSSPWLQSYLSFLLPHPTYISRLSKYFTPALTG